MSGVSVIVPAFNEEKNIGNAIIKYERIVKELFDDYEIIIVDDGSKDKTSQIADKLVLNGYDKVWLIRHSKNWGIGRAFKTGLKLATKDYVIMLSGEGDIDDAGIRRIFGALGEADIIKTIIENNNERPWYRRLATKTMTTLLNIRFGLRIKYYSGYVLYRRKDLEGLRMTITDSTFQAQILVQLIKGKGLSYKEISYYSSGARTKSNIFKPKNIFKALKSLTKIIIKGERKRFQK
jgi:dolichol-phosphate mannosyltransferase